MEYDGKLVSIYFNTFSAKHSPNLPSVAHGPSYGERALAPRSYLWNWNCVIKIMVRL